MRIGKMSFSSKTDRELLEFCRLICSKHAERKGSALQAEAMATGGMDSHIWMQIATRCAAEGYNLCLRQVDEATCKASI